MTKDNLWKKLEKYKITPIGKELDDILEKGQAKNISIQEKEIKDGFKYPNFKVGGCYQWTYCSECMLYPMGIGCPKDEADKDLGNKILNKMKKIRDDE